MADGNRDHTYVIVVKFMRCRKEIIKVKWK